MLNVCFRQIVKILAQTNANLHVIPGHFGVVFLIFDVLGHLKSAIVIFDVDVEEISRIVPFW